MREKIPQIILISKQTAARLIKQISRRWTTHDQSTRAVASSRLAVGKRSYASYAD